MTMAGDGATKVVKPEAAVMPGIPASNGTAPAGGDPANGAADPANSYWAAQAAVMQSYYNGGGNPKAQAPGANGQQAAAYYAQMAQQPNLYAQMWANPVRDPHGRRTRASSEEDTFSWCDVVALGCKRVPSGVFSLIFLKGNVSFFLSRTFPPIHSACVPVCLCVTFSETLFGSKHYSTVQISPLLHRVPHPPYLCTLTHLSLPFLVLKTDRRRGRPDAFPRRRIPRVPVRPAALRDFFFRQPRGGDLWCDRRWAVPVCLCVTFSETLFGSKHYSTVQISPLLHRVPHPPYLCTLTHLSLPFLVLKTDRRRGRPDAFPRRRIPRVPVRPAALRDFFFRQPRGGDLWCDRRWARGGRTRGRARRAARKRKRFANETTTRRADFGRASGRTRAETPATETKQPGIRAPFAVTETSRVRGPGVTGGRSH